MLTSCIRVVVGAIFSSAMPDSGNSVLDDEAMESSSLGSWGNKKRGMKRAGVVLIG